MWIIVTQLRLTVCWTSTVCGHHWLGEVSTGCWHFPTMLVLQNHFVVLGNLNMCCMVSCGIAVLHRSTCLLMLYWGQPVPASYYGAPAWGPSYQQPKMMLYEQPTGQRYQFLYMCIYQVYSKAAASAAELRNLRIWWLDGWMSQDCHNLFKISGDFHRHP